MCDGCPFLIVIETTINLEGVPEPYEPIVYCEIFDLGNCDESWAPEWCPEINREDNNANPSSNICATAGAAL